MSNSLEQECEMAVSPLQALKQARVAWEGFLSLREIEAQAEAAQRLADSLEVARHHFSCIDSASSLDDHDESPRDLAAKVRQIKDSFDGIESPEFDDIVELARATNDLCDSIRPALGRD